MVARRGAQISLTIALSMSVGSASAQPAGTPSFDLLFFAERLCLEPDGDHQLTWTIAARDGYTPIAPADVPGLQTPGARELRGFAGMREGSELRILTAVNRFASGPSRGPPAVNFHICWVSARPTSRIAVDRAVKSYFSLRRFRQEGAYVYAWIPQQDGTRIGVRRSQFNGRFVETARDNGMKVVMTNEAQGWVSITFMRPVASCADWCY